MYVKMRLLRRFTPRNDENFNIQSYTQKVRPS